MACSVTAPAFIVIVPVSSMRDPAIARRDPSAVESASGAAAATAAMVTGR